MALKKFATEEISTQ